MSELRKILFQVNDVQARLLVKEDFEDIQTFFDEIADFFNLHYGLSPEPAEAQSLFSALPEGKSYKDKFVIGFFNREEKLIGILDAIRDYKTDGEWAIGLLALHPNARNRGLGSAVYHAFEEWVIGLGAQQFRLGVAEMNERAYSFWKRLGFEEIGKTSPQKHGNKVYCVVLMRKYLST